jgi:hypothetical protein
LSRVVGALVVCALGARCFCLRRRGLQGRVLVLFVVVRVLRRAAVSMRAVAAVRLGAPMRMSMGVPMRAVRMRVVV